MKDAHSYTVKILSAYVKEIVLYFELYVICYTYKVSFTAWDLTFIISYSNKQFSPRVQSPLIHFREGFHSHLSPMHSQRVAFQYSYQIEYSYEKVKHITLMINLVCTYANEGKLWQSETESKYITCENTLLISSIYWPHWFQFPFHEYTFWKPVVLGEISH